MPEMTIRLIPDPVTGKKNIVISLTGDQDTLPHEHEQMHRQLVEKALGKAKVQVEEITREEEPPVAVPPQSSGPQATPQAAQQGR